MKALRIALSALGTTLLTLLALAGALWLWSGASTSLATSLEQLAQHLPVGQTLEAKDVAGSLRRGGSIGWLRWQHGALSVEARDVSVSWSLPTLLEGELRLGQLSIGHLRIEDRRPGASPTAPTDLRLPLRVAAPFSVTTLEWAGPAALEISGLAGHYAFDNKEHTFELSSLRIAAGNYRGKGRLQALAPMALALQIQGTLLTQLPSGGRSVALQADATLQGQLAGSDARLALQAQLKPDLPATPGNAKQTVPTIKQAMQASVTAELQPWQPQPVVSASAHWQALDLAALWPRAPQTLLSGDATVTPAGQSWHAAVQLSNTLSGPWNQQRLPIDRLNTQLVFVAGQWTIASLQASGAGGRIDGRGQVGSAANWQGSASLHGINPAALDSRLAITALDGQVTARQTPSGIAFEASLQGASGKAVSPANGALAGLRLQTLRAQGIWQAPMLKLDQLALQSDDAQLQGQLSFNSLSHAAQGQLALTLPGASATLQGDLASRSGQGQMSLRVTDAALATHWLARWPGAPAALNQTNLQGAAEATGNWQGGWQNQGQELRLQASVRAPKLELRATNQTADQGWRLRDWQADISGTLGALNLSMLGQADQASRHFALQMQAKLGRLGDGLWQAQLETAQLGAQDSLRPGLWRLQLRQSVALDWKQSEGAQALHIAAGSAALSGPVPGAAAVNWQAAQWSRGGGNPAQTGWQTQGRLEGLPLAWLDLLGQTQMANLGLRGDLLFGGQWDLGGGDRLRLRATLERSSGDLQLQTDAAETGGQASTLQAGVRTARLLLSADAEQLAASLRWDSERAGQVQADFSTLLRRQDGIWTWPGDAPLSGTLRAQLPSSGAWSLLAPPGWRLRGTLAADATLSGTRRAPQWQGTLGAQELAVRSLADGIDFSQGTLRASLTGQRLDIDSFTLQGAGGNNGGRLSVTGSVVWLPATPTLATPLSRLRMALDFEAKALRVTARADQRLVLSGKLTARLDDTRLTLRGALKADEALFILPEDTAPQLGADVRVRIAGDSQTGRGPPPPPATPAPPPRVTPDVAVSLDLGQNFEVRGRGLATHLAGTLELRSTPGHGLTPQLSGELRTVGGSYKAYGQQLDIEEGQLRFTGPYDNPALDILALRPNLQQRVGVQISGTALSPVVRLYAEPDMAEADKLAWLVLGRSAANGGAESAMLQQAALALLGGRGRSLSGNLAEALGLDELSVRGAATGSDGSTTSGATVTLGKRVSRNFYVAYERSLAGALGTFYIFYDLSRRFTLRAQTGEQSAVDLIFTLRYD